MRCFVAVDIPEDVKNALKTVQSDLRKSDMKGSFTKDFHLTLKFLGELTQEKVEFVKKSLSSVKFRKFATGLNAVGVFPGETYIRVVWVGLTPDDEVIKLQKSVDEELQKDFKKEKQFKAHLTLARVKYVADKERFMKQLKSIHIEKKDFTVNEFKLKRSTLTAEGPVYEDLEVYKS